MLYWVCLYYAGTLNEKFQLGSPQPSTLLGENSPWYATRDLGILDGFEL